MTRYASRHHLHSLPFTIYKKSYPILYLRVGHNASASVHIFDRDDYVIIYEDIHKELTDFQREVFEHYIITFIHLHYQFMCDTATLATHNDSITYDDMLRFFDRDDISEMKCDNNNNIYK